MLISGPGGLQIRARTDIAAPPGAPVKLVVRPESLRLLLPGESEDNVAEGALKESVFVGGVSRYFVMLQGGAVLSAKQLTGGRSMSLRPGDAARLGWSAADTLVLPA